MVSGAVIGVVLVLLALDVHVAVFGAVTPDRDNAAYAAAPRETAGCSSCRCSAPTSTSAPSTSRTRGSPHASGRRATRRRRRPPPTGSRAAFARSPAGAGTVPAGLGIRYVIVHRGLYGQSGFFAPGCAERAEQALRRDGWRLLARDGAISSWER